MFRVWLIIMLIVAGAMGAGLMAGEVAVAVHFYQETHR
jgi:hypothetical protein